MQVATAEKAETLGLEPLAVAGEAKPVPADAVGVAVGVAIRREDHQPRDQHEDERQDRGEIADQVVAGDGYLTAAVDAPDDHVDSVISEELRITNCFFETTCGRIRISPQKAHIGPGQSEVARAT